LGKGTNGQGKSGEKGEKIFLITQLRDGKNLREKQAEA